MTKLLLFLLAANVPVAVLNAGTITGIVRAEGKSGVEQDVALGRYESRRYRFVERVDYSALKDFVIYIDQPIEPRPAPPADPVQVVTQEDATFLPHVLPIMAGTTVEWPNRDDIYHNVFSHSEAKPFDLGLYKDGVKRVLFDRPGRVDVFCSIHSKMHCIILVLENPFFATANAGQRYAIRNVPAGTYRLKAWHERLPAKVVEVNVPAAGTVEVNFTMGISDLPQY